jgi:homocitrate synthase NifV
MSATNQSRIYILDVTNRDGVQTSRICLSKLQKTILNTMLNDMGVAQSEFGFPVTRHEINYLNANLELVEQGVLKPMRLSGWLRATRGDVETAFRNVPKIKFMNLSISTSDQMIMNKFKGKLDHASVIREMTEATRLALEKGAQAVGVNAEDASRTGMDYLIEFSLAAKEAGASRIRYCDTLGYDSPFSIYDRIRKLALAASGPA